MPSRPALRVVLNDCLEEMRHIQERITFLERKLVEQSEIIHGSRLACLRSVPGAGAITASSFLAELFRPERFTRGEEVAAYLGLAPIVRHSGEKSPAGRLRPTGHSRLRALLVEAAWIWKIRDPGIQTYYMRMLSHTGLAPKAIRAIARKLALVLWLLACECRLYRIA